jgi:hypothetical protein
MDDIFSATELHQQNFRFLTPIANNITPTNGDFGIQMSIIKILQNCLCLIQPVIWLEIQNQALPEVGAFTMIACSVAPAVFRESRRSRRC